MPSKLPAQLRRLSELLGEASTTLEAIAGELERRPELTEPPPAVAAPPPVVMPPVVMPPPPPTPPSAPELEEPEVEPPWEEIVERAIELLRAEPRRTWKPAELGRAVRDSGVAIESLQGLHFGLMPRLRQRGAVREGTGGFQASELLAKDVPPPPSPSAPAAAVRKPPRELPWPDILRAARTLLEKEPERAWGQAELVRAVRDSGVPLDNLQGIHFGLTGRLVGLGLADADKDGKLRLGSLIGGSSSEPETASKTASSEREPQDEIDALAEEIDACEFVLDRMPIEQRTAQVAVWAGRARELQERWKDTSVPVSDERRGALRRVFGRLTRITRESHCEWIDALTPGWSMPWPLYLAHHEAALTGEPAPLLAEEQQALWRALLRGLVLPNRVQVAPRVAAEVIAEASEWLEQTDDDLRAAKLRFGDSRRAAPPTVRRAAPALTPPSGAVTPALREAEPEVPAVTPVRAPNAVLELTRGRRAVIVGGTGAREDHREKLQQLLALDELDWATSERGATGAFARIEERVRHRSYDLVLFLAGYTSHKSVPLLKACKAFTVPLVYVPRGYSAAQVLKAIEEQLVKRVEPPAAER